MPPVLELDKKFEIKKQGATKKTWFERYWGGLIRRANETFQSFRRLIETFKVQNEPKGWFELKKKSYQLDSSVRNFKAHE